MNGISVYQNNSVTTQTPGHLVVMLYEGAIKFLNQTIEAIEADNVTEKGRCVSRALEIVNELDSVLDMDNGGDIALNLRQLYDFIRRHIMQGHIKSDPQMFRDVIGLLQELNDSWRAISM